MADGDAAATALKQAVRLWGEAAAPYDAAKARLALARALAQTGARFAALAEADGARATLERLGAQLECERAKRLTDELRTSIVAS